MHVNGRDYPRVEAHMDETGILTIRVDFDLYPAGWVELTLLNEDLESLQRGESVSAKQPV